MTQLRNTLLYVYVKKIKSSTVYKGITVKTNAGLTHPAGQTATLAAHWVAAVCVETVAPLAAVQPEWSFLSPEQLAVRDEPSAHSQSRRLGRRHAVLTGHGRSHSSSLQPGEQVQLPLSGSHAASLAHWHVWLQLRPQVPLEQGMEQSTPCQPGKQWIDESICC